jgi:hypothetical protein
MKMEIMETVSHQGLSLSQKKFVMAFAQVILLHRLSSILSTIQLFFLKIPQYLKKSRKN